MGRHAQNEEEIRGGIEHGQAEEGGKQIAYHRTRGNQRTLVHLFYPFPLERRQGKQRRQVGRQSGYAQQHGVLQKLIVYTNGFVAL